jgi:site-specific recombinase XerD
LKVFLKDTGVKEIQELNQKLLEEWFFQGRLKRKWGSVTFRSYHKNINCFFKWLIKEGVLKENYVEKMEKPRLESKLPRTLSFNEAKLILDAAFHMQYRYKFEKYRNRAAIGFMLLAGLRKGEVANLKINDISLENRIIFIHQGKGHKDRMIPINSRLFIILDEYLKDRERLRPETLHFLISYGKDQSFGIKGINNLIFKLKEKTKIDFSAHTLRHGFARLMLEGGCDIYTLSKIMGHAKITTTTIYLSCSNQQMSKSIEMQRHDP